MFQGKDFFKHGFYFKRGFGQVVFEILNKNTCRICKQYHFIFYFLPLPIFNTISAGTGHRSYLERENFRFLMYYFRPLNVLISDHIRQGWFFGKYRGDSQMAWNNGTLGTYISKENNGEPVCSWGGVIKNKLSLNGLKNGLDPGMFKLFSDSLRSTISVWHTHYFSGQHGKFHGWWIVGYGWWKTTKKLKNNQQNKKST